MSTFINNCETFVSDFSVITDEMVVGVAVRDGREHRNDLPKRLSGKQLPLSLRSNALAARAAVTALSPSQPRSWRMVERSMRRRHSMPASDLPAAAWAALVLARVI